MNIKVSKFLVVFTLATVATLRIVGAEADMVTRLNEALKTAATFEYGKDSGALVRAEQLVMENSNDPMRRAEVEGCLLQALDSASTRDGKEFICRQLFTVGTDRSIPSLEKLLTDPALSHMARFALGRNESPAAVAALRRALTKTSGAIQVGLLNTLGLRQYGEALPEIKDLLNSPDPMVAKAAATAMGMIGGGESVRALEANRAKAPEEVRKSIDAALLVAADRFLANGQSVAAAKIYDELFVPSQSPNLRIAALRGLAAARQEKALPVMEEAIRGNDPGLRAAAISCSAVVRGTQATKSLAGLLPSLSPEGQQMLMHALSARGDAVAMPEVIASAKTDNPGVRASACAALGTLGDASVVELLVQVAATAKGEEQSAARASLLQLKRGDIDGSLVQVLSKGEAQQKTEALRALAGRHAASAFGDVRKLAAGPDGAIRREAIHTLGILATDQTFPDLVAVVVELKGADDLAAAEEAITLAMSRVSDPERQAAPLLSTLSRAPVEAKPSLLRLLSVTGTAGALTAVRTSLKDGNAAVAEAAVRSLADWPNATPADELLGLARTAAQPTAKVIALRGYVRMAAMSKNPAEMYARALEMAERPEDKKLVLSSLGGAEPKAALTLVEPYLKQEQLRSEAALAMVQIAERLRQSDAARAKAALREVMDANPAPGIRQQAQEVINQLEEFDAHILQWVGAGPYQEKEKDGHALFDSIFPPEEAGGAGAKWARVTKGLGKWDVNLADIFGASDNVVAYLRTQVWSPSTQDVRLEMGSDDGIKAWLNGKVIHANNTDRGLAPRQDIVKVALKEGWNELLLKVTNQGDGWACSCRIRKPDGSALDGLKYEAK